MTDPDQGPVSASEIEVQTAKTEDELRRERSSRAVQASRARREALRAQGADVGVSTATLGQDLEARLKARDDVIKRNAMARKAAAARVALKRGEA